MSEEPSPLEAAQMNVLQMFGAVCADPDSPTVAEEADAALRHLEDLLASAAES